MAGTFGANPQVARAVSQELAQVRSEMDSMGRTFDGYHGATGSARIESALHEFFAQSSDNRKKMDDLLKRASGLLQGLAEGTTSVDTRLAHSLDSTHGSPAVKQTPATQGGR